MRKKTSPQYILAVEEGKIYASVKEAAQELGVDPSNLRAVLAGRRKTAGGYHFATTKPELSARTIAKKREKLHEQQIAQRISKQRSSSAKAERAKLISNVKDKLQAVNQMMKAAKKENLLEGNETLQKMLSHTSYYGQNKQGGYYTSTQYLSQYSNEELENLLTLIEKDQDEAIERDYYEQESNKGRSLASFATEWGITKKQAAEYRDLIPYLYDLVRKMQFNTSMKYSYLLERVYTSMQQGIPHDQLEKVLAELTAIADQTSEKSVGDITRKYLNKKQVALWQKMREEKIK